VHKRREADEGSNRRRPLHEEVIENKKLVMLIKENQTHKLKK
jgi:hypothetical protein